MKRFSFALVAVTLLAVAGMSLYGQGQPQNQAPRPARSRSDEMLDRWNDTGNKLIAMAQDFPEDKYDFKLQKDERTFAENLLHAAALDFVLIRRVSGSNLGPDFGEGDNPSREVFKTKADVVKFVQEAIADGARVIQQQGDTGLDSTSKFFGNRLAHNSFIWMFAIEHSGEHYGQLVVYYRANNLVPPDSRRDQAQQLQQPPAAQVVAGRISAGSADATRVFELRVYHPAPGKLQALEARFRDKTSKILARHDLQVLAYWTSETASGADGTFIWVLAHTSREDANKNWEAMRADPEFQELVKAEQAEKLVEKVETTWMRPADFSPMK